MLPQLFDILAVLRVVDFETLFVGKLLELGDRGFWSDFDSGSSRKRLEHRDASPFTAEVVDGAVIQGHLVGAEDIHRRVLNQTLG